MLVGLVFVTAAIFAFPNLFDEDQGFLPEYRINLGLDLQGGSYLLLSVDMDAVIEERLENTAEAIRTEMRQSRIGITGLEATTEAVMFNLRKADDTEAANQILATLVGNDIEIDRTENRFILIQLPGVDDPEAIKRLLGRTARLGFQLVDTSRSALEAQSSGRIPPGSEILPASDGSGELYLLRKRVLISGDMLDDARPGFGQNNDPVVNFTLNSTGGARFGKVTGQNIGRPFAIVLDDKVISAPVIRGQIFSNGQISGNFSIEETDELSLLLRAGALPAPLNVLEERSVGPGLGSDSIAAGKIAAVIGMIGVVIFVVASYGVYGVIATIALAFNMVMIIASLSLLQATLTLPGIAGIVLTMGMAVDANVLIFERIREELKKGRTTVKSVTAGFSQATTTIVDANLTTLFAVLFLYLLGSGPIKGFSVTLGLGVITSMFTAILVTRMMVSLWINFSRPKQLVL